MNSIGSTDSSDFISKMFEKTDTDGDGLVTQDEFAAAMEKRLGKSTETDNATVSTEAFNNVDTDGDGSITASEFETAFKAMKAEGQQPPPPPPGPPATDSDSSEDISELFSSLDTDGDGTVSLAELQAALTPSEDTEETTEEDSTTTTVDASSTTQGTSDLEDLFASIDTDGDGAISETEFQTMLEQMQENRPPPPPPDGFGLYTWDGSSSSPGSSSSVLEAQA